MADNGINVPIPEYTGNIDVKDLAAARTAPLGVSALNSDIGYSGGYDQNPNYKWILTHHGKNERVTAYLPEQFHFRIANDWEPFLASLTTGALTGAVADVARNGMNVAGKSINIKALSALVWKRTEPLTFNFTLQFDARESAEKDVKDPTQKLIQFASPTRSGGIFLDAPGPSLGNQANRMSLLVGRFFYMDSVVIQDIDITYYTASDIQGDFIAADAEITLLGWYTPDAADILQYFGIIPKQASVTGQPVIYNAFGELSQAAEAAGLNSVLKSMTDYAGKIKNFLTPGSDNTLDPTSVQQP